MNAAYTPSTAVHSSSDVSPSAAFQHPGDPLEPQPSTSAGRPQKHSMLDDMLGLCLGAVAGRAEVMSPSSFWLRSAADADLTDVWMCYRRYDTVTHDIRTLSASEDTAAG